MTFDMNRIWAQAVAMVRADWQHLALIGGIFFLLPNLMVVVGLPDLVAQLQIPVSTPEEMIERLTPLVPTLVPLVLASLILTVLGYAAMISLLAPGRPTVGEALGAALRALPTLIGCLAVAVAGYLAFAIVGGLVVALLALALGLLIGPEIASAVGIGLLLLVLVWVALRFVLVTPVVMLDKVGNPLAAFARSWRLTKTCHRRLCAFLALLVLPYLVISSLISNLAGLSGSLFFNALVSGLVGLAFAMLMTAIIVALHGQLTGNAGRSTDVIR